MICLQAPDSHARRAPRAYQDGPKPDAAHRRQKASWTYPGAWPLASLLVLAENSLTDLFFLVLEPRIAQKLYHGKKRKDHQHEHHDGNNHVSKNHAITLPFPPEVALIVGGAIAKRSGRGSESRCEYGYSCHDNQLPPFDAPASPYFLESSSVYTRPPSSVSCSWEPSSATFTIVPSPSARSLGREPSPGR